VGLLVTAFAAWWGSSIGVDPRLVELFPADLPAGKGYRVFLNTFGGFEKVFVLITAETDVDSLAESAQLLAERLEESPLVAAARAGLDDDDEKFFLESILPRAPVLIEADAVEQLHARLEPQAIAERVSWMRARLNGPTAAFEAPLLAADPLGLGEDLLNSLSGGDGVPIDADTGAFLSGDGSTALVVITPGVAELDPAAGRALLELLDEAYVDVRAEFAETTFEFHSVGGPLYAAHDERIIRGDLTRTITGSAIAITLLLLVYFGGVRIPIVLGVAILAGLCWTAAFVVLVHGRISVIGISFGSILLGLGVDYGIHGATRFRQALLEGHGRAAAMAQTLRATGRAILASVLTTAAAFFVLTQARFEPVSELGQIVAFGIAALLTTSVIVGASLLVLLPAYRSPTRLPRLSTWLWSLVRGGVNLAVDLGRKQSRAVVIVAVVLSLLALFGVRRLDISGDLRSFRPTEHPALEAERMLAEIFSMGLDTFTVVVQAPNESELLVRAAEAKTILLDELGADADVSSPSDWLVSGSLSEQRAARWDRAKIARGVDALRSELDSAGFDTAAFEASLRVLQSMADGQSLVAVPSESWPDWVAETLRHEPDRVFGAVRVRTPVGRWPDGPPETTLQRLLELDGETAIASVPLLASEMRGLVGSELARLGAGCLLAIAFVVTISFRGNVRNSLMALAPVMLGCLWLLGLCGALGLTIDPLSMTVAPLLLGIGIDDGLHALHGARFHGGLTPALRHVGQAMTVTTMTTCIGFGSLTLSQVPALRGGGMLVALGTMICLMTTLIVLPALEGLTTRKRAT